MPSSFISFSSSFNLQFCCFSARLTFSILVIRSSFSVLLSGIEVSIVYVALVVGPIGTLLLLTSPQTVVNDSYDNWDSAARSLRYTDKSTCNQTFSLFSDSSSHLQQSLLSSVDAVMSPEQPYPPFFQLSAQSVPPDFLGIAVPTVYYFARTWTYQVRSDDTVAERTTLGGLQFRIQNWRPSCCLVLETVQPGVLTTARIL